MAQCIINTSYEEDLKAYEPSIYFHPGGTLSEKLEEMGLSVSEFAERVGLSTKIVTAVVRGKQPVTPELAEAFFRGTKIPTYWWLVAQKDYDAYLLRKRQAREKRKAQRLRSQATHDDVVQHPLSTPLRPLPTSVGVYA